MNGGRLDPTPVAGPRRDVAVAAGVVVLHLFLLSTLPVASARVVDDVSQLVLALVAATACLVAARRAVPSGPRAAWYLIAVSWGAWALAQAYYTIDVHLAGASDPFPSPADVGFVVGVTAGGLGIVLWNAAGTTRAVVLRDLLDGAIIAASLLTLMWVTTLQDMWASERMDALTLMLSMVYPVGDVLLAAAALLAATRATSTGRTPLAILSGAFACLAISDIVYLHLTSVDAYDSGQLVSTGWVTAFVLVVVAARWPAPTTGPAASGRVRSGHLRRWPQQALPYLPLVTTFPVLLLQAHRDATVSEATLWVVVVLFALVLVRQLVVLSDNRTLVRALRRDAHVDPLTGLANRRAVEARIVTAIEQHAPAGRFGSIAVLMCDVNGLKRANDVHGHDAGDEVLRHTAALLRRAVESCARGLDRDLLVGRLGGDEFAIVLTGEAADQLLELRAWIDRYSPDLPYGAGLSCGSGRLSAAPPNVQTPQQVMRILLRLADGELYAHKQPTRLEVPVGLDEATPSPADLATVVQRVQRGLAHAGDGPDSAAARLGVVAAAFAKAVGASAWWVSAVSVTGSLDDVLSEQVRLPADPIAPARLADLATTVHDLADYPASEAAVQGRIPGFHVTATAGDSAERTFLASTGYGQVLASGGPDGAGRGWLIEVFGDSATGDLGPHLPLLAALVAIGLDGTGPLPPTPELPRLGPETENVLAPAGWSVSH